MRIDLPDDWRTTLAPVLASVRFAELGRFVDDARARGLVLPDERGVWSAFTITPLANVRVVTVDQDRDHDDGQAHGLCFSVRAGTKKPPSWKNLFAELARDVGVGEPAHAISRRGSGRACGC